MQILDVGKLKEREIIQRHFQFVGNMRRLLNNEKFFLDVTFIVDGSHCTHRAILSAQCDQFHAMFMSGMKEAARPHPNPQLVLCRILVDV